MPEAVSPSASGREGLLACFEAAIEAARPAPAVAEALARLAPGVKAPWILAVGKAAGPMAQAAIEVVQARGGTPAGGVVIGLEATSLPPLEALAGDHPVPGPRSARAVKSIERCCAAVPPGAEVWVLLSGGTTSLIAAPAEGLSPPDLARTFDLLLRSGADIVSMNQVRRRISRLAGGGLARHLRHCRVVQLVVSDVPGDDLASIGSGPLVPDASSPEEALETVARLQLTAALPPRVLEHLRRQTTSGALRTGSGGEAKPEIRTEVIVSNRVALAAAADAAKRLGWTACIRPDPLEGEASDLGRRLAVELGTVGPGPCPSLVIWGGEPAVTLGPDANGTGGRAQELALAAAETLEAEHQEATLILSAGTDGRDGNSDAAGAIVDGNTWRHARAAGVDPREALRTHDSHRALAAARALLRTGPTGTNVMDVVMGLRWA